MGWWFAIKLWQRVLLGLVLGVVFGVLVAQTMDPIAAEALLSKVRIIGDIFIRLIRMIVVPLVFFTLVAGIYAMGDPKKLGTIGLKAFVLYILTTFFANIIGLGMGTLFQPGVGVDLGGAEPRAATRSRSAYAPGRRRRGVWPKWPKCGRGVAEAWPRCSRGAAEA